MENGIKIDAISGAKKVIAAVLFHSCAHGCPEQSTGLPKTCPGVPRGAHGPAQNHCLGIPGAAESPETIPKSTIFFILFLLCSDFVPRGAESAPNVIHGRHFWTNWSQNDALNPPEGDPIALQCDPWAPF